jgi:hypothetical protein
VGSDRAAAGHAVAAAVLVLLGGCASGTTTQVVPTTEIVAAPSCPVLPAEPVGPVRRHVIVDYVDFIQWAGRQYLSDGTSLPESSLGPMVGVSRCSFSELNERTGQMTPDPGDGDTAFLAAGTPIFAVTGWSADCRLAARRDGRLLLYLSRAGAAPPLDRQLPGCL